VSPLDRWIATLAESEPATVKAARELGRRARGYGLTRADLFAGVALHRDRRGGWGGMSGAEVSRLMFAAVEGLQQAANASRKNAQRTGRWGDD